MSSKQKWIIGLSVVLLCGSAVQAGSVQLKFDQVSPSAITKMYKSGSIFNNKAVYVGRYNSTIKDPVGADAEAIFDDLGALYSDELSLKTWCMDVYKSANTNWNEYNLVAPQTAPGDAPMGSAQADDLNRLFTGFIGTVDGDSTNRNLAAAFQAAVWEIVNETDAGYDVTGGGFSLSGYSTSNWASTANGWLNNLGDYDVDGGLKVFSNAANQDFVYYIPPTNPPGIMPEPLTMLAVGSAVAGLGGYIRRRRRDA